MMSLVYGPSALCYYPENEEYLFAGVGSFIRVLKGSNVVSEFEIFPSTFRITEIQFVNNQLFVAAEDQLIIIKFKNEFKEIEIIQKIVFSDWIVTFSIKSEEIEVVLHHAQIAVVKEGKIVEEIRPPLWKIAMSAKIIDSGVLVGDSFGTISLFNRKSHKYFEINLDKGGIFDIDFEPESRTILTVQEFHTVAMFKLHEDKFELLMNCQPHSSRVFRCKFVSKTPVSLGEDGFMVIYEDLKPVSQFHLHRTKIISAFAAGKSEVCSAGFDSNIRRFKMPTNKSAEVVKIASKEEQIVNVSVMSNGKYVAANNRGDLMLLPDNTSLGRSSGAFFLLNSNENRCIGASRAMEVLIYNGEKSVTVKIPRKTAPSSVAISKFGAFLILSDLTMICFDFDGNILCDISVSEYFKRAPIVAAADNNKPILVVGAHSTRITIFEFSEDLKTMQKGTKIDGLSNGFAGVAFSNGNIYCAGRNDGIVTILSKKNDDEWSIKSSYLLPAGSKSSIGISSFNDKIIVGALSKDGVSFYDISTQTAVGLIPISNTRARTVFSVQNNEEKSISAAWWDLKELKMNTVTAVNGAIIGPSFHGLRGLCATRVGDLILTGSCDRDIRCWSVKEGKPVTIDIVQSVDSGTHAIASDGKDIFTGGSQQMLFHWTFENNKIYHGKEIDLTPMMGGGLCKRRVTALALSEDKVFVGMSDASLIELKRDDLSLIAAHELPGVPMSLDYLDGVVAAATSTGAVWFSGRISGMGERGICGLHCIKLIKKDSLFAFTSGDDGLVRITKLSEGKLEEIAAIGPYHTGGLKAIDVKESSDAFVDLVSFSYDQTVYHLKLDETFNVINEKQYSTPVSHGESICFIEDGFAVFGTGIHFFKIE